MNTILRIDASSRANGSISRTLGDYFEAAWLDRYPHDRMLRRDVVTEPIRHIAAKTIAGFYTPADRLTDELRDATALSDRLIAELRSADILLVTVPMYNFSVPSALKAWIDQIVRIGHTFAFDGSSFSGLVTSRQAYVICAYGAGSYAAGSSYAAADFLTPYLRFMLGFLGVRDVRFFGVEETATSDEFTLAAAIERAKREIDAAVSGAAAACIAA